MVLILTDDQPTGTLPSMPNVTRLLAGRGVDFTNAIVPTSLCCRAAPSLLTGQLATKPASVTSRTPATAATPPPTRRRAGETDHRDGAGRSRLQHRLLRQVPRQYGPLYDGVAPRLGHLAGLHHQTERPVPQLRLADARALRSDPEPLARSSCASTRPRTWAVWPPIIRTTRVISHRSQCSPLRPPIRPSPPKEVPRLEPTAGQLHLNPSVLERDVSDKAAVRAGSNGPADRRGVRSGVTSPTGGHTAQRGRPGQEPYEAVKARGRLDRTCFVSVGQRLHARRTPARREGLSPT